MVGNIESFEPMKKDLNIKDLNIKDLNVIDNVLYNIGTLTSYGTWNSNSIVTKKDDIILEFILLISLNYSNKQNEYDFLMNSDIERINFKKELIKQLSENTELKDIIKNVLIEFLNHKQLILTPSNLEISFNILIIDSFIVLISFGVNLLESTILFFHLDT